MKKHKQQSFEYGAVILLMSTIASKIIGAVFKIPLNNLIGDLSFGYFSSAYDLFTPIYGLAMAGLPIAVSRMVAESTARREYKNVRAILSAAKKAFMVTGIAGFTVMLLLIYPFVSVTDKSGGSIYSLFVIAPSILFCCITSVYRGYYEGLRNMFPTAVSDVIEALSKLVFGYTLAYIIMRYNGSVELAAAGAIMGVTIGTVLASAFLILRYRLGGSGISEEEFLLSPEPRENRVLLKSLITIAIPVVLSSLATNISGLIDVSMVKWQLGNLMDSSADVVKNMYAASISDYNANAEAILTDATIPTFLYGVRGKAFTVYNLIPTISSVLGVSALPVLASVWTSDRGNKFAVRKSVNSIIKFTSVIALPAGIGMCVLSAPIMAMLYNSTASVEIGAPMLAVFGIAAVFAGLSAPMTSMLQAIGKQMIPVRNIAIGAAVKIAVNFVLVGIPEINIHGAPIGTLCSFVFIFFANLFSLIKYSGVTPDIWCVFIKPLICALACGGAAYAVYALLGEGTLYTALSITAAAAAYVVALVVLHVFSEEDLLSFPMGKKLARVAKRLHIV